MLEVKLSGAPSPTITWFHGSEEVGGDYTVELTEDGFLFFPCTETRHGGMYCFKASNTAGSVSGEVELVVYSDEKDEDEEEEEGQETGQVGGGVPVDRFKKYVSEIHLKNGFPSLFEVLTESTT